MRRSTRTSTKTSPMHVRSGIFFETAMLNQADRLFGKENLNNEELCTLELVDVEGIM